MKIFVTAFHLAFVLMAVVLAFEKFRVLFIDYYSISFPVISAYQKLRLFAELVLLLFVAFVVGYSWADPFGSNAGFIGEPE